MGAQKRGDMILILSFCLTKIVGKLCNWLIVICVDCGVGLDASDVEVVESTLYGIVDEG